MRARRGLPGLAGLLACAALLLAPAFGSANDWSRIARPSQGAPRVIGGPSNGCITGAMPLPETGSGYVDIRRHRNRFYGHPSLLAAVGTIARQQHAVTGRLMVVGDLAQPRGGPMASMHRSHQNGLDVDIWLTLANSASQARAGFDHGDDPPGMVAADGDRVSRYWGGEQRTLLETIARHSAVDRLLVNPAIKRQLCREVRGDRSWLRKVRPWWKHTAHTHVRLRCPSDSPQCRQQAPVPPGDGCDRTLDWWFSEEARSPKKPAGKPRPRPPLPAACSGVLHQ